MNEVTKQAIADIITVMSRAIGEEKNIPVAVKEMEIEYLEGNSDGFSFKAIVDLVVEERAARIAAETKLAELEDENRKLIRYGTFIFNRVNFSIGRAKSKIADKAVISCMQKITEISKARSKS